MKKIYEPVFFLIKAPKISDILIESVIEGGDIFLGGDTGIGNIGEFDDLF